jgi:tetratricopeptide (TPR) repeat protein
MLRGKCDACAREFPFKEMARIQYRSLCIPCAEAELKGRTDITPDQVARLSDPTICFRCRRDYGAQKLETVAGLPTCHECETFLRNRPYPTWVRWFFAGLAALVILGLAMNVRFIRAYLALEEMKKSDSLERSLELSRDVARLVPENRQTRGLAQYWEGVYYLSRDEPAKALPLLKECQKAFPDPEIAGLVTSAQIAVVFDARDYDSFLRLAQQELRRTPKVATAAAQVASAYACKYAVTGDESFRASALAMLEEAKKLEGSASLPEYEARIRHRLQTREIISREEFQRRYPGGWKGDDK